MYRLRSAISTGCYMLATFMAVGGFLAIGATINGWVQWVWIPTLWIAAVPVVWLGNIFEP